MISNKILYIFGSGRSNRIKVENIKSTEFFYSYFYLKNKYPLTNLIEMKEEKPQQELSYKFLLIIDKILRKLTNLPFYFNLITTKNNFVEIFKANKIIATNDRLGLSILPMVLISKIFKKSDLFIIVMGLFSKERPNFIVSFLQKIMIIILLTATSKLFFLGDGEYKDACRLYPKKKHKFVFTPFCVDTNFWKLQNDGLKESSRNSVLFIGNDGNRDYDLVLEIANLLSEVNFIFITNYPFDSDDIPENVKLIQGSWNQNILSDEEILNYYSISKLTVLPIKNTFQPSGQSVSLQSMSLGTPVMITDTKGFWDKTNFTHNENIFFVKDNTKEVWASNIIELLNNNVLLKKLSVNSINTVNTHYRQEIFDKTLEEYIGLNN